MAADNDPDVSPKLRCPGCGATEARTLIRSRAVAFVRCTACGMAWSVLDRRQRYRSSHPAAALSHAHGGEQRTSTDGHSPALLWRVGVFACELRRLADLEFPAVVCVFKDGALVLEVPVVSALEAEERSGGLRILVERHQE